MIEDLSIILQKCSSAFERENKDYDDAVGEVFKSYPQNVRLDHILIKVSILNSLYRTNIYQIYRIAQHIHQMEEEKRLDSKISAGDLEAVELLRKGHGIRRSSDVNFSDLFSFATKYCHWHQPDYFPIYDSRMESAVRWLAKRVKFTIDLNHDSLYNVQVLKRVVEECRGLVSQEDWKGFKKIDQALYELGYMVTVKSELEDDEFKQIRKLIETI